MRLLVPRGRTGVEYTLSTVVGIIVLLLVLVAMLVAFFGGEGLMTKSAGFFEEKVNKLFDILRFNSAMGADAKSNAAAEEFESSIIQRLEGTYLDSEPCLIMYKKTKEKFSRYKIELNQVNLGEGAKKEDISLHIQSPDGKVYGTERILGKNLCVIANLKGEPDIVGFFRQKYIQGKDTAYPIYQNVDKVIIDGSGPVIYYGNTKGKMDDSGLLYRFDAKHICFIPTKPHLWSSSKDYITEKELKNLLAQASKPDSRISVCKGGQI